jgi:hypothetical protein
VLWPYGVTVNRIIVNIAVIGWIEITWNDDEIYILGIDKIKGLL